MPDGAQRVGGDRLVGRERSRLEQAQQAAWNHDVATSETSSGLVQHDAGVVGATVVGQNLDPRAGLTAGAGGEELGAVPKDDVDGAPRLSRLHEVPDRARELALREVPLPRAAHERSFELGTV